MKWPWSRPETQPNPAPTYRELEDRLYRLERDLKALRDDWDAVYEKFARLNARLAKRAKDQLERVEQGPESPAEPETPFRTTNPLALAMLNGRGHPGAP